jgi:hypothetical protein
MLVLTPLGRERTEKRVRKTGAGRVRLSRVIPTESPLSITEAVKA